MLLDVGRDHHRCNPVQGKSLLIGPLEELADGPPVSTPSILVANLGGEELEEAFLCLRVRFGDERWEARLKDGGEPAGTVFGDFPGGFVTDLRLGSVGHGTGDCLGKQYGEMQTLCLAIKHRILRFLIYLFDGGVKHLVDRWRQLLVLLDRH